MLSDVESHYMFQTLRIGIILRIMPLLSTSEALHVSDSFLSSLYGDDIFRRWKELKDEMKFLTEREYVSWLIDVANHYRNEDESLQLSQETATNQFTITNVKTEQGLDHYNQGQGQSYETPVSDYSHLPSTQDTRNSQNYSEQFTLDTKAEGAGISNEQTSVTSSQVDDYKYEQSYYDDVREDEKMLEIERNEEIILSSDDEGEGDEGGSGTMDDGNDYHIESAPENESQRGVHCMQSVNKKFTCPHCSYGCNQAGNLKAHILAIHEKRKPFPCQHCNYRCSQKTSLKSHLIHKHGYRSKYCCAQCGKYFNLPTKLQQHMNICRRN